MARFLVAALPRAGHVNPTAPVVRALLARGHEAAAQLEQLAATGQPVYSRA